MVLATCEADKAEAAREAIVREVAALPGEKPTAAELARAKRLLTTHHLFGRETTAGHTSSVGYHCIMTGQEDFDDNYPDLVAKVTAPTLTKTAGAFLEAEAAAAVVINPAPRPVPRMDQRERSEP
jgi:predicted Zn-dependent peptidase